MYLKFTEDMRLKAQIYERIHVTFESNKSDQPAPDVVIVDKFVRIQQRWTYTTSRTRVWLWKLDKSLPGAVGRIGEWICQAEEKVAKMHSTDHSMLPSVDAAQSLELLIRDLMVYFCFSK